jgi:uncharacterized protein YbcI
LSSIVTTYEQQDKATAHPAVPDELESRSPMLEIANAMVRLYKSAFGRGPTKARAQFAGPDALVVFLENSLTVAERNLATMGEHDRLREARTFLQHSLEHEFRAIVEQALGRRTIAFLSGVDTEHDVVVEVFTLEPPPPLDSNPSGNGGVHPPN